MPGAFILNDLSAVFSTADFATTARVDNACDVNGVFEDPSEEVQRDNDRVVMVIASKFICPTSSPIRSGSTLLIDGASYEAKTPDHDGTGVTTWMLKRNF
jgi:hypothetical protein